jgi:hypothetical protein
MKNILLSGLIGGVVFFILGGLTYGFLLADFFENHVPEGMENVAKDPPDFPFILIAELVLAIVFAFVLQNWTTVRSFSKGATLGLVIALGYAIHYNVIFDATTNLIEPLSGFVDVCVSGTMGAIGVGAIGAMLGKLETSAE